MAALSLCVAATAGLSADVAGADSAPSAGLPATVSADGLATWQINGVAWAQVVVGNTVYVTGSFTAARPPGSPLGKNEVARSNLLAYDIRTGNLITGFDHKLNAQGRAITASPDGSRVYVGGSFTTVDGAAHSHVVAFSTATGALINGFKASANSTVRAMTVTNTTVYVGGDLTVADGVARSKTAAYNATTGALTGWNPSADAVVTAMTQSPDKSLIVLGGGFTHLGASARYGMGAVDLAGGAATPWTTNQVIQDAGTSSGITSLSSDSTAIYGSGFTYQHGGNFEGTFAMTATGSLIWMNDCHGDTYSTFPTGQVLYSVSHSHYCANMGAWPGTNPRTFYRAMSQTTYRTGTLKANGESGYTNFAGQPDSTQLDWYPNLTIGTYTGQQQAAWSVTGNAQYVVLGGEFPKVNGVAQQGLVRMAVSSLAPNKIGPVNSTALTPTASSVSGGIKVTWGTTYDQDNAVLTYRLYRDGASAPVATTTVDTRFWTAPNPTQSFTDKAAGAGSHTYRITASDPFGNGVTSAVSNAVSK